MNGDDEDQPQQRRATDGEHPQSSPDINSIQLTVMRMFLAVKGGARFILIPAVAVMGIMSQFYTQGIQALLAGATAWTSLRNQELSAQAAQQQAEIEKLRVELETEKEKTAQAQIAVAPKEPTEDQKRQEKLDKRIVQLNKAIEQLKAPKEDAQ